MNPSSEQLQTGGTLLTPRGLGRNAMYGMLPDKKNPLTILPWDQFGPAVPPPGGLRNVYESVVKGLPANHAVMYQRLSERT
jgi:hypothetical protein